MGGEWLAAFVRRPPEDLHPSHDHPASKSEVQMTQYPYGSLPGEIAGTHVHISKGTWWLLRKDPGFLKNWNSSAIDRPYHIAVACLTRGLTHDQLMTVVRIWHLKHGHGFYEDDFMERILFYASLYATPLASLYKANEYWSEIRRIEADANARQHSKLRVAYFLMNTEQATAREISEKTAIPLKTVRNSILALQDTGKVVMTKFGVYRAVQNLFWDRATLVGTIDDGYVWDDDDPATYSWGQIINEYELGDDGCWRLMCYDYCRDEFRDAIFDNCPLFNPALPNPGESEWVVNADGDVVENGNGHRMTSVFAQFGPGDIVGHRNGNRLDFRKANLVVVGSKVCPGVKYEDVDYFGRLCA
jgi:hypothetical protein